MKFILVFSLMAILTVGCASHDEVSRVRSPDGHVDAVLIESNGGATTSFWYDVYIVRSGWSSFFSTSCAYLYGAIRNRDAYGVNLVWECSDTLALNVWQVQRMEQQIEKVKIGDKTINVVIRKGIEDIKAPAGGMLYNLEGRPYDRK